MGDARESQSRPRGRNTNSASRSMNRRVSHGHGVGWMASNLPRVRDDLYPRPAPPFNACYCCWLVACSGATRAPDDLVSLGMVRRAGQPESGDR